MSVFFLVVGLEIRREIYNGDGLSDARRAVMPLVAALGGVVVPAFIHLALASSGPLRHGWAVPTATDIAFAVGVLTLLGNRVPPPIRVLLLALAVIDDVAAVLIIAFFYSSGIHPTLTGVILGLLTPTVAPLARERVVATAATIERVRTAALSTFADAFILRKDKDCG